eukprot:1995170-Rhodomonas_salina.2
MHCWNQLVARARGRRAHRGVGVGLVALVVVSRSRCAFQRLACCRRLAARGRFRSRGCRRRLKSVSYTHLRAHETEADL